PVRPMTSIGPASAVGLARVPAADGRATRGADAAGAECDFPLHQGSGSIPKPRISILYLRRAWVMMALCGEGRASDVRLGVDSSPPALGAKRLSRQCV